MFQLQQLIKLRLFLPPLCFFHIISLSLILPLLNIVMPYMPEDIKAQKIENNDFLLYENPIVKIKIQYPFNWTKTENAKAGSYPIIKFSPPEGGFSKLFIETDRLSFDNISLAEYANQQINRLSHLLLDFKHIESSTTIIGTENAEKVVYTFMLQNIPFKKMEIWLIKDSRLYTINYVGEETKYMIYLPIVERMINSFEITW
jgi:hypothetical protein